MICRHSSTDAGAYNFLFSDIDLSAVLAASQLGLANNLRESINRARRVFIFLGELEIYSTDEYAQVEKKTLEIGEDFLFIRNLRKIGWIEDDLETYKTGYHQKKAKRALGKIFSKYSKSEALIEHNNVKGLTGAVSDFLSKIEPNPGQTGSFKVFVNYLGFSVAHGDESLSPGERGLYLPRGLGLVLLATVPFESNEQEISERIKQLRMENKVQFYWKNFLEIEIATLSAVYRANPDKFPWMPSWLKELRSMV